jgi:pyruvate/2-oxoglutarate dehydrogenase complex dihydrolipoamide dehydrogenase (E3) component
MKAIKSRIQNNMQQIYEEDDSPEAMKKLGIDTIVGKAMFQQHENMQNGNDNEKTKKIQVTNEQTGECSTVYAKYGVLICTGAKPTNPNIPGLVVESKSKSESKSDSDLDSVDLINYLTYEHAFEIDTVPKSLTVVGGGPIGVELAQAYSRLGAKVTIIANKLLPREEPEASDALQRVFENEGIVVTNSILSSVSKGKGGKGTHLATCQNGETITGDMMLVSVGRKPVVDGMGLSDLGVEINDAGGIQVDKNLETTVKGIYAAGDCTGDRQFTHYAGYQGAVGARNILLPFSDPGVLDAVPGTTFTDPQIASVGMTEEEAKKEYGSKKVGVAFQEVKETDRGICDNIDEGYIKVVYLKKNYKILGASIMSPVAGELIAEICVAMKNGMSFDMMATVIHTYPSHSFALQSMAAELYYDKLVKLRPILNFLKWIGL